MIISDDIYQFTFFVSITILVILGVTPSFKYKSLTSFPDMNLILGTTLLLILPILFIGLRNPFGSWRYFGDTYNYTLIYQRIQNDPFWQPNKDLGFYFYMKTLSKFLSIQMFYLVTAILYVVPVYYAFLKWFKKYAYFALIIHVSSLSFWSFGINGMRNGLASSIFILALAFYHRKWIMLILMGISISFHTTMLLPAVAFLIVHFYNDTKVLLKIWAYSIVISFIIGKKIESSLKFLLTSSVGLIDDRVNFTGIKTSFIDSSSRFRIDFIFYGALVIALGYYFMFKLNYKDAFFKKLFNVYLIANTVWLYFIYFPYTNRIAYLSWFLIPVIAIYPIIYSTKQKNQSYLMAGSVTVSLIFAWLVTFL